MERGWLLGALGLHSAKLCPSAPAITGSRPLPRDMPGVRHSPTPSLTSTLQRRSLKPQVPLLEEQHKALSTPSHSALSDLQ